MFEVINLHTGESHGEYETLEQARGCVAFDRLDAYQIWREDGARIESCEPYEGNDDRVRQALGEAPWEQPS